MTDIAEFLAARIAEDEAVAREAVRWSEGASEWGDAGEPDWQHIARHDPARVLAECEAKRRIVVAYERNRDRVEANVSDHTKASARGELSALPTLRSVGWDLGGRDWALEMTLRLLALPYADHPDYDEAWRP